MNYIYRCLHTSLLFLLLGLCVSCTLERSHNGHLDGFWRLTQVDTLQSKASAQVKDQLLYWAIQKDLLEMLDRTEPSRYDACLMRFEKKGDSLRLYDAYRYNRTDGDEKLSSPKLLRPFGVSELEETFYVVRLTNRRMTLRGKTLQLWFEKM